MTRKRESGERERAELAALADGSLDPQRRLAAERRVAGSAELGELLAEQERAVALMRSATATVEAPPTLRARVERGRRVRRGLLPRRVALGSAFAATALAVGVGAPILLSRGTSDRLRVALAPTPLLPDASGDATLEKTASGWRIQLRADGLPRVGGGGFYEAWLRNGRGVLVPVGTFDEGTEVTLWAGVSPLQFTTMTITREQADGDQASSGEQVLVGAVRDP